MIVVPKQGKSILAAIGKAAGKAFRKAAEGGPKTGAVAPEESLPSLFPPFLARLAEIQGMMRAQREEEAEQKRLEEEEEAERERLEKEAEEERRKKLLEPRYTAERIVASFRPRIPMKLPPR